MLTTGQCCCLAHACAKCLPVSVDGGSAAWQQGYAVPAGMLQTEALTQVTDSAAFCC